MWNLTALGRGFVRNGYLGHEQFSSGVVLTAEHPATEITFALAPQAMVKGIVTDEAGEAVRNAQVSLVRVEQATPEGIGQSQRRIAQTDDRGVYEFDGLQPGEYRLCVTAQPWYAVAAGRGQQNSSDSPPLDPSLDVAYPVTWFPGSSDPDAAEALMLKGGDVREADFHLQPVPALHLLIDPPAETGDRRGARYFPVVQRVDGGNYFVQPVVRTNADGQIDVGGLTPGLYQVQLLGPGAPNLRASVQVATGGQTLSFNGALNEANVTIEIDGIPEDETGSLIASLIGANGRTFAITDGLRVSRFNRSRQMPARVAKPADGADKKRPPRMLNVPPGKYNVVLRTTRNNSDIYLAGITAKGAQVAGRQVTLPEGASTLTLHVVEGRAQLAGVVARGDKPSVGTLVMLVPATLDEPGAIQFVRRDESNTDGSFIMRDIIPGEYILIAVEDGWDINWKDKATLARYLGGGVAVSLAAKSNIAQNITAQRP